VVVEEQIEEELLLADEKRLLAPIERESGAELEQELLDVVDQRLLQLALARILSQLEEVEDVGILHRLQRPLGIRRLERDVEVGQRGALALV
jgi:hypothetical protein